MEGLNKSFSKINSLMPCSSFISDLTTKTFQVDSSALVERILGLFGEKIENFEFLRTKQRSLLFLVLLATLLFGIFKSFSPFIATLGIIILVQVLAILRVNSKLHFIKKCEQNLINAERLQSEEFNEIDETDLSTSNYQ